MKCDRDKEDFVMIRVKEGSVDVKKKEKGGGR